MNKKRNKGSIIGGMISIMLLLVSAAVTAGFIGYNALISAPRGKAADTPADPLLILVNSERHVPKAYAPELLELANGERVDKRIYPDLQAMFDDMRAQGLHPYVREGFRTAHDQRAILEDHIRDHIRRGASPARAYSMSREEVAAVGNSEHQLGLAVDINSTYEAADPWEVYGWLAAHAWEYGFILRYPLGKTEITGITYEPWHYRYVGRAAAAEIYSKGITLEEYCA